MRANRRPNVLRSTISATSPGALHKHNPSGSKRLRKAFKKHFHLKSFRAPYSVARAWYKQLLDAAK